MSLFQAAFLHCFLRLISMQFLRSMSSDVFCYVISKESFTRGEVSVSPGAFPLPLHRLRVHRDQEAKIFWHSVQQVPCKRKYIVGEKNAWTRIWTRKLRDGYTGKAIALEPMYCTGKSFEADFAIQRSSLELESRIFESLFQRRTLKAPLFAFCIVWDVYELCGTFRSKVMSISKL